MDASSTSISTDCQELLSSDSDFGADYWELKVSPHGIPYNDDTCLLGGLASNGSYQVLDQQESVCWTKSLSTTQIIFESDLYIFKKDSNTRAWSPIRIACSIETLIPLNPITISIRQRSYKNYTHFKRV